ncbi:hypothetical protein [Micromonospora sp. NPDC005171]
MQNEVRGALRGGDVVLLTTAASVQFRKSTFVQPRRSTPEQRRATVAVG